MKDMLRNGRWIFPRRPRIDNRIETSLHGEHRLAID
jgi:hypothetical protein